MSRETGRPSKEAVVMNKSSTALYAILWSDPNEMQVNEVAVGANTSTTAAGFQADIKLKQKLQIKQEANIPPGEDEPFIFETAHSFLSVGIRTDDEKVKILVDWKRVKNKRPVEITQKKLDYPLRTVPLEEFRAGKTV